MRCDEPRLGLTHGVLGPEVHTVLFGAGDEDDAFQGGKGASEFEGAEEVVKHGA